ncbi:MAG: bifunctional 1-(5-phosphoribosyl)-5-((5-phosphoribosylamino)methylideneamino)imidazole-4-carboxamide isomerase/phosphoribosylanthranilate isomerase PriA [Actinomycetales bacterium]|nr:bifunctional 1-(5-phosphoribosyl)-5-((5-phosphoribosylamino)methylideneamino)imidazole-4-carboxamide isomerase/phosphoribosylanthranilate isomerase PriA [Actinomycetales bacterium]
MSRLMLLPALDIAGGRASQVVGDAEDDPGLVAAAWVAAGAEWVHLVDLDRAFRRGENAALIAELVAAASVPVQVSGGIDDEDSLRVALASGATRVNLASTALRDREWVRAVVREHGERIAVGVDVRAGEVVARGTEVRLGPLDDVLADLDRTGCRTYVVADASRDGSLHGADVDLFRHVAERVDGDVIASGGVASLDDLRRLCTLTEVGVRGVVLGAALYHGAFTLAEALEVARGRDDD